MDLSSCPLVAIFADVLMKAAGSAAAVGCALSEDRGSTLLKRALSGKPSTVVEGERIFAPHGEASSSMSSSTVRGLSGMNALLVLHPQAAPTSCTSLLVGWPAQSLRR